MNASRAAHALGWFSVGLGAVQLIAPGRLSRAIGVGDRSTLMRAMGVREIAHGVAVLAPARAEPGLWSRVAGDTLDAGLLLAALASGDTRKGRVTAALGMVLAVGVADLLFAKRLSTD